MSFSGWYYHVPSQVPLPVAPCHWVEVIDHEGYVLAGWSEEFNWVWKIDPLHNIIQYRVRESKGVKLLTDIVEKIPTKERLDILFFNGGSDDSTTTSSS